MADQTKLLRLLAARPAAAWTLDELGQAYAPGKPFGPKTQLRKQIINAVIHTDMTFHFPLVSKVTSFPASSTILVQPTFRLAS